VKITLASGELTRVGWAVTNVYRLHHRATAPAFTGRVLSDGGLGKNLKLRERVAFFYFMEEIWRDRDLPSQSKNVSEA
jgi:hypothetical protein